MVIQIEPITFYHEVFLVSLEAKNKLYAKILAQDPYEKLMDRCIKQ